MRRPPVSAVGVLATTTVVFVLAVVLTVVLKVRSADDDAPDPVRSGADGTSTAAPATLADLADDDLVVGREAFCDRVDRVAVATALQTRQGDAVVDSYDNGDLLPTDGVTTGSEAVAHEYGCSWTGSDGTLARAWVFAPPVAPARAKRLATTATRAEGCAAYTSEPFGDPTAAYVCTDPAGVVTAGRAGLFGDAWLSCSVTSGVPSTAPATATAAVGIEARADAWCAAVALAGNR